MPELVALSHRNHRHARPHRPHKRIRRRSFAPVMRHLQKIRRQRSMLIHQFILHLLLNIPRQQKTLRTIRYSHHQRIIVRRLTHLRHIRRPKHLPVHTVPIKSPPLDLLHDRHSVHPRFRQQHQKCRSLLIPPNPQFAHVEIRNHTVQTIQMIVMRVRQRHHVQPFDPPRPQIRRHDFLAHARPRPEAAHYFGSSLSAAVHQHRPPIRKGDEYRITLAHIQHAHLEFSAIQRRSERMPRHQNRQHQRGHRRAPLDRMRNGQQLSPYRIPASRSCNRSRHPRQKNKSHEKQNHQPQRRPRNPISQPRPSREPLHASDQQSHKKTERLRQQQPRARPHHRYPQRHKSQRHNNPRQQYRRNIAYRPCEAHPMEILGQQWQHSPLNHRRKQNNFPQSQSRPHRQRQQIARARRNPRRRPASQPLHRSPHLNSKLRNLRRVRRIPRHIPQMIQPRAIRRARSFHPRQRQTRNHRRSQKRKLKTGIAKGRRFPQQQNQRGHSDRIQQLHASEQRPRAQIKRRHQSRPQDRRTILHNPHISRQRQQSSHADRQQRKSQTLTHPPQKNHQRANMQPRYHEHVICSRFLECQHHAGIHKAAVAQQHRPRHRPPLRMPNKKGIQPRQQTSTRARQPLQNCRRRPIYQLQQFAAAQRTQHINVFARQKTFHIERARIQIIPRRPRLHQNLHAIASPQSCRRFRNPRPRIKIHAQPARCAHRRVHLLQINLESLAPRQRQRIFAQSPPPAQRNPRIHAPRSNQSRNMIRRNRRPLNTRGEPANRGPRQQRKKPSPCDGASPR